MAKTTTSSSLSKSKWTKEEINILTKYYLTYTNKQLIEKFGLNHPEHAINSKKSFLGLIKRSYKLWSKAETENLLKLVEQHPYNLKEAFRIHASMYDRAECSVGAYFSRIRKKSGCKTCMMTIGKNNHILNRKNVYKGVNVTPSKHKVSKWRKMLNIIFE